MLFYKKAVDKLVLLYYNKVYFVGHCNKTVV